MPYHIHPSYMGLSQDSGIAITSYTISTRQNGIATVFKPWEFGLFMTIYLHETSFTARMSIAHSWMQAFPPTFQAWIAKINNFLPLKKPIYISTIRYGTAGYSHLKPVHSL